ncbi:hypothetical protein [Pseudonocardia parietis]|uniref:Uncharacterized protein n=1 Tax=Pseudonocardia parietis TaxID=570936 RepID=A0ABS4W6H5_9PSEU|nr:hypothetical protein [Pseudonocardia parietis]MBP2371810.1 hypothetical protein [Pseudonocardia parietis]
MAGKQRAAEVHADDRETRAEPAGATGGADEAAAPTEAWDVSETGTATSTGEGQAGPSAARRLEGHRWATVDLPFVTAEFRAPQMPSRGDLDAAAHGAWSMLPSGKSMLFLGGLAATAVAGVIEWPVAVAIGVGSALAGRSTGSSGSSQEATTAAGTSDTGTGTAASGPA